MTNNCEKLLPVAVVFGPTASGKTAFVSSIFRDSAEIINSDALQVYRHMSIGTAKPTVEEQNKCRHHLVDFLDPRQEFSVGDFVRSADSLIPEILSRGKIPVISGGTAFYIKTFLFGMPETPVADMKVREEVEKMLDDEGLESLYLKLKEIDPESAVKINQNDTYRVCRALEVYYCSGQKLSSFKVPETFRKGFAPVVIGLDRDRELLYNRINLRVDQMFEHGLYEEVLALLDKGYTAEDPGMKAIGYSEFFDSSGNLMGDIDEVKRLIKRDSRRYAKRQLTFFRKIPQCRWASPENSDEITGEIQTHFKKFGLKLK